MMNKPNLLCVNEVLTCLLNSFCSFFKVLFPNGSPAASCVRSRAITANTGKYQRYSYTQHILHTLLHTHHNIHSRCDIWTLNRYQRQDATALQPQAIVVQYIDSGVDSTCEGKPFSSKAEYIATPLLSTYTHSYIPKCIILVIESYIILVLRLVINTIRCYQILLAIIYTIIVGMYSNRYTN